MKGRCDMENSLKYLVEVMLGIQHMHNFRLFNLNVNPENILVTECIKLTDYGLKMEGKNQKPKRTNIILKKENINYIINAYTSPEELNAIINRKPCILNGKTDSWNCGILLYEMLTKFQSPFKGKNNEEFIKAILNCEIDLEPIKDPFCRDLISKLVRKNPQDRIDINEVLNMDEIKNVDIEQPVIDFIDNIINPIDEQEFLNNTQNNAKPDSKNNINGQNAGKIPSETENKNQHLNKELTNLKSENDNLKQLVDDLRKQVVSSGRKKRASKHVSNLKSMVIDVGSEIVDEQNIQRENQEKDDNDDGANLDDLLNDEEDTKKNEKDKTENKIKEIKKK
jgi:serine/threonine protein kinase